ncbi:MAG: hypothetical protein WAU11_06980 [Ignavibacteriaceae bacterium]
MSNGKLKCHCEESSTKQSKMFGRSLRPINQACDDQQIKKAHHSMRLVWR